MLLCNQGRASASAEALFCYVFSKNKKAAIPGGDFLRGSITGGS